MLLTSSGVFKSSAARRDKRVSKSSAIEQEIERETEHTHLQNLNLCEALGPDSDALGRNGDLTLENAQAKELAT